MKTDFFLFGILSNAGGNIQSTYVLYPLTLLVMNRSAPSTSNKATTS